ncbi:MAG: 4Fe-4S binding protein, partial [Oscillospiraceae bacterium]|nr:4Fe-4S binding protein [Oscillospiraceae bacterium]
NVVYNGGNTTTIILDNRITGMTGHQENPLTGKTLKGTPAPFMSLEKICEAAGVKRIRVVDPLDLAAVEAVIREETAVAEPSVIITRSPCALLKSVKRKAALKIDVDKCKGCKMCMKIGCPAISFKDGKARIDETLCVGCDVCKQMCKFGAIL